MGMPLLGNYKLAPAPFEHPYPGPLGAPTLRPAALVRSAAAARRAGLGEAGSAATALLAAFAEHLTVVCAAAAAASETAQHQSRAHTQQCADSLPTALSPSRGPLAAVSLSRVASSRLHGSALPRPVALSRVRSSTRSR